MARTRILLNLVAAAVCILLVGSLVALPAAANLQGCRNCIEASDIARGAVRSEEIKNGTIRTSDLRFNPATQFELTAAVNNTTLPLALGRVESNGSSALSGWLLPASTSWDSGNGRYVFDYSAIAGGGDLDHVAAVVTPESSSVEKSYFTTDDAAGEIYVYFRDSADVAVQTDFGVTIVV